MSEFGTKKSVIEVDYNDVDNLISENFPEISKATGPWQGRYDSVAYEEWSNDQSHSMDIDGKLDEDEVAEIEKMREAGKWQLYRTYDLLNYLCYEGRIEPGEYLISVSW